MSSVDATIVITTKNRANDLAVAVESSLSQSAAVEVLVIDDGSTDGTSDLIGKQFPKARLVRHEQSRGYIVRRNEAAAIANGPVIVSIDDDAAFPSRHTVGQALTAFDRPYIGAVAIPFIDVRTSSEVRQ